MLKNEVMIPEGVEIRKENGEISVKGTKGENRRFLKVPHIKVEIKDKTLSLTSDTERKKIKAVMGTWTAILRNMMDGVRKGWTGEVKLVYSHFPVKIKNEDKYLVIENFLGERNPRRIEIPDDLNLEIKQNTIIVSGTSKERVGQMLAMIEQKVRTKGFDRRVFQDGCYITKKPHIAEEGENDGEKA